MLAGPHKGFTLLINDYDIMIEMIRKKKQNIFRIISIEHKVVSFLG